MIYYGCPRCGVAMASPDSRIGQSETCPDCGNVATVPAQQPPPASEPAPPPIDSAVPSSSANEGGLAKGEKKVIWTGRPSHWYYLGHYILASIIGLFALLLSFLDGSSPAPMLLLFLAVLVAGRCWIGRLCTSYTVTSRGLSVSSGILSRDLREVPIAHVREVRLQQGFVERIFGLGTLGFSTAASSDIEVVFRGVASAKLVRGLVQRYIR